VQSKTTGEQTTKGLEPIRQAISDVKLHNQLEKDTCFYTFMFTLKGLLLAIKVYGCVGVIAF